MPWKSHVECWKCRNAKNTSNFICSSVVYSVKNRTVYMKVVEREALEGEIWSCNENDCFDRLEQRKLDTATRDVGQRRWPAFRQGIAVRRTNVQPSGPFWLRRSLPCMRHEEVRYKDHTGALFDSIELFVLIRCVRRIALFYRTLRWPQATI
jgi:hypothetical protein